MTGNTVSINARFAGRLRPRASAQPWRYHKSIFPRSSRFAQTYTGLQISLHNI